VVANVVAISVSVLALAAELLHARRVGRIAHLAFGPTGRPRPWVMWAAPARAVGLALLTWGLVTLCVIEAQYRRPGELPDVALKRLIIALDVSPSMHLSDAGEKKDQPRAKRAADVLMSVLDRISLEQTRVSVVAFYSGAKPVVVDTRDPAVVKNIVADLPLDFAFDPGKTELLDGIATSFELARPWREKSATLLVISDGDTVPYAGMPQAPPAIARVLVLGVGDAGAGRFIDDHNSRQDAVTLRQLASRLRGTYHDANARNVPSDLIAELSGLLPVKEDAGAGRREAAIAATALGGFAVAALPFALALLGTSWRPGVRNPGAKEGADHAQVPGGTVAHGSDRADRLPLRAGAVAPGA
jgi:Ca-activated chloride channel family protein